MNASHAATVSTPVDAPVLRRPLTAALTGRGDQQLAERIASSLTLSTVGDLLGYPPRRLAERGELTSIDALVDDEQVTIVARIETVATRRMQRRRGSITEARIGDGRAQLTVTFFNAPWAARALVPGEHALFSGKVSRYRGVRQLLFPDFTVLDDPTALDAAGVVAASTSRGSNRRLAPLLRRPLIPIYPATRQVPSWDIAYAVERCLEFVRGAGIEDPLPPAVRQRWKLVDLLTAWSDIHQPLSRAQYQQGRRRLAFDEALGTQLVLVDRRRTARQRPAVARPHRPGGLLDRLDGQLPFTLTAGQRQVGEVIAAELAGTTAMQRLLQGEVGSGKTVVALRAMLQVVDAGGQAALLAPTEVLASQHARSLASLLGALGEAGRLGAAEVATRVVLLTGSMSTAARRVALLDMASGGAGIVVGTHALLAERVSFAELGLVVVDEQHRFGVQQRDLLRARADRPPHLLVMTATPIPRTVAMTVFGDLEMSLLPDRPPGRAAVTTTVVALREHPSWLDRAWTRIGQEAKAGRQAFIVCPRIGDDGPEDTDDVWDLPGTGPDDTAADPDSEADSDSGWTVCSAYQQLTDGPLSGLRVAILHGRLPGEQKDAVMTSFAAGQLDVLVATTVIEVGVDIANATVLVVLDADRLGISQLHQLRGRIGRGEHPGVCLLVTDARPGSPARARLEAVAASTDGFELAEVDLRQRREGDVLGAAQSGTRRSLRLLSLLSDRQLITDARTAATELIDADPLLSDHPGLRERVAELASGDRADYLDKS